MIFVSSKWPMHHHLVLPPKVMCSSSNLRHCHFFLSVEFRERVLCGVTSRRWARRLTNSAIVAHSSKSGCTPPMELFRFALIDYYECGNKPSRQASEMLLKGSADFPGRSHRSELGISGVLGSLTCWRGLVRSSVSTPGLAHAKEDGCGTFQKAEPGRQFSCVSNEESESQEERDRRERRLWEKGLRKNIYESLRKDRITAELFPDLNFALEGNYYPKLVFLVAQKINSLLEKGADDEIAELLDFLGISLNPHLVGEALKAQNDWEKSVRFFVWAKYQPEYEHTGHTYNLLLYNLAKAKNETPAHVVAALDLLQEMVKKGLAPSTVAVNIVIDRLCKAKKTKVGRKIMRELEGNGVCLDLITYNSVINGLGKSGKFKEIFELLDEMELKGIEPNLLTYNSIIHSLGNSGRWQEACKVFDELSDRGLTPDVVTYNSLIFGLYKGDQADEAFKVFGLMALRGCQPDVVTYNSLIEGLAKARRVDDALKIFKFMKRKNCTPDVITYNTLIGELIFRNKFAEVSALLVDMKETGCIPDRVTRNLLMEIGQADKIDALWVLEPATANLADNEDACRSSGSGADNSR